MLRISPRIILKVKRFIKYELKIIIDKDMSAYFLILADVVNWAHKQGILVGYGRGSVAGCLLAYLLGIHNVGTAEYIFKSFPCILNDALSAIWNIKSISVMY